MRVTCCLLIGVLAAQLSVPLAVADEVTPPPPDAAAVAEARKRYADGQKLFDKGDLKGAVDEFKEAYRLTRNPLLLYNIGFVYDKLGDEAIALHYYGKFIDEAKDTERTHAQLGEASARANVLRAKIGAEPAKPEPATQPSTQPVVVVPRELVHEPIDQAPPGKPIDVVASVPRDVAWTITLHYRAPGVDLFQGTPMKPITAGGTDLVARIPAGALRGTALQYYIAARDPDGKLVSSSGRAGTPHIVYLDPEAPPHLVLPDNAEAGPVPPMPEKPKKVSGPKQPLRLLTVGKWVATGSAAALVGTGIGLYFSAKSYSDTLEIESDKSMNPQNCPNMPPPCTVYSQPRKDLESVGQSRELWANVLLWGGLAVAAGAGALWYLDAHEVRAAPMIGPGVIGGSAQVTF